MPRMTAVYPDGSRFLADLSRPSGLEVTIGEAYTLAQSLKDTVQSLEQMSSTARDKGLPESLIATFEDSMLRTIERIAFIERTIDLAKDAQVSEVYGIRYVLEDEVLSPVEKALR